MYDLPLVMEARTEPQNGFTFETAESISFKILFINLLVWVLQYMFQSIVWGFVQVCSMSKMFLCLLILFVTLASSVCSLLIFKIPINLLSIIYLSFFSLIYLHSIIVTLWPLQL